MADVGRLLLRCQTAGRRAAESCSASTPNLSLARKRPPTVAWRSLDPRSRRDLGKAVAARHHAITPSGCACSAPLPAVRTGRTATSTCSSTSRRTVLYLMSCAWPGSSKTCSVIRSMSCQQAGSKTAIGILSRTLSSCYLPAGCTRYPVAVSLEPQARRAAGRGSPSPEILIGYSGKQ
jgi:hypothetical protein